MAKKQKAAGLKAQIINLVGQKPMNASELLEATGATVAQLTPVVGELVNTDKTHTMKNGVLAPFAQAQIKQAAGVGRLEVSTAGVKAANNGTGRKRVRTPRPKTEAAPTPIPVPQVEDDAREDKPARKVLTSIDQLSKQELKARIDACADEMQSGDCNPLVAESLDRIIRRYNKQLGKRK
jgi:hypothetical protein